MCAPLATHPAEGASDFRGTLAYAAPELLLAAPCTNKIGGWGCSAGGIVHGTDVAGTYKLCHCTPPELLLPRPAPTRLVGGCDTARGFVVHLHHTALLQLRKGASSAQPVLGNPPTPASATPAQACTARCQPSLQSLY